MRRSIFCIQSQPSLLIAYASFFSTPLSFVSARVLLLLITISAAGFSVFAFVLVFAIPHASLPPCPLCVWQRVAWGGAMMCAALSLIASVPLAMQSVLF